MKHQITAVRPSNHFALLPEAASTAQIIKAHLGQSKAETAFRDLKDPRMLSAGPRFRWTDQKPHVPAFCMTAYLLVALLHRNAMGKAAFEGSSRRLFEERAGHIIAS